VLYTDNLRGQIESEDHKTGGPFKKIAMAEGNTLVWNFVKNCFPLPHIPPLNTTVPPIVYCRP
jgi:hypothetical protein